MSNGPTRPDPEVGSYEVRLQGHLDVRWAAWFDGLEVTTEADGTTTVSGRLDQAALHGLLQRVRDVGLSLLAITRVPDRPRSPHGHLAEVPTTPPEENDMSVITRPVTTPRVRMGSLRKTALVAGALYLLTFISIPTLFLYGRVLGDPGYVTGPGPDTPVIVGGLLEVIVALAGVGTAVALYPVVRRQNGGLALGFVASRTLEAAAIVAGVVSLMSLVTLRQAGAGDASVVTGQAFVAQYNWFFLLGQSLMPALNALLLGTLLYRSRLVPRALPLLGLVLGAPLLLTSDVAVLFGLWERLSAPSGLLAIPVAVWEFSLGVYLLVHGFKPCALTAGADAASDDVTSARSS